MSTPARELELPIHNGCRIAQATSGTYLDGAEEHVRSLIAAADDRTTMSDELAAHAATWEERYHLSPMRGNIVRPLRLGPDTTVLEVGAGCGAVTRCLGEAAGVVDALEPTAARAEVARLRTADLDGVEVFVGHLDDLPRAPAYDVVILVGVLEYVGGRDGLEERVALLREAAARLKPAGSVVVAVENRIGVQYLAGAPEDHRALHFEGVNGYPRPSPVRTFARHELEPLFRAAGLEPRVHHVFPDYKFARMIFSDQLVETPAWRVPRFPSDAAPHPRAQLTDEARLWRSLVQAGSGGAFANSFLVIAGADGEATPWPDDLLGAFYSLNRRSAFATETRIVDAAPPRLVRRRLAAQASGPGPAHGTADSEWIEGTPLLERLEEADYDELAILLQRWREHVERAEPRDEGRDIDLGPHNVLEHDGALHTIDEEWFDPGYDSAAVVARGLLNAAILLADRRAPEQWPDGTAIVRDVYGVLARAAGADDGAATLADAVRREAELLAHAQTAPHSSPAWRRAVAARTIDLDAALQRSLADTALVRRTLAPTEAELDRLQHDVRWLHGEVAQRDSRVAALSAEIAELRAMQAQPRQDLPARLRARLRALRS